MKYTCYNHYTGEVIEIEGPSRSSVTKRLIKLMWYSISQDRRYGFPSPKKYTVTFRGSEIHFKGGDKHDLRRKVVNDRHQNYRLSYC